MKFEFYEASHGTQITMRAETIEESASLLRLAQNTTSKPVNIDTNFSSKEITTNIWIEKRALRNQKNYISKDHKIT